MMKIQRLARRAALITLVLLSIVGPAAAVAADNAARTVLITGSNRGLGFEFVKQYSDLGWNIIASCRNPDNADELNVFAAEHDNVAVEYLDLLDHKGIDALAEKYKGQPIDVLVNNAGLMRGPDLYQMVGTIDYDEFDRFYRINAMGPLKVIEAFYPNVKAGNLKVIAALTTGQGEDGIPVPGFSLYKTSKAALDSIQREVAIRWKRQGVKVVTLQPGRVLTHGESAGPNQNTVDINDSIGGMIVVIDHLTMEQSGHTINWDGKLIN